MIKKMVAFGAWIENVAFVLIFPAFLMEMWGSVVACFSFYRLRFFWLLIKIVRSVGWGIVPLFF